VEALAVAADRIAASDGARVTILALPSGRQLDRLDADDEEAAGITGLHWAPDGRLLIDDASGGLRLVAPATRKTTRFAGPKGLIAAAGFSARGTAVFAAAGDGSVQLWRSDGTALATLFVTAEGRWLAIAADGRVDGDAVGAGLLYWEVGDVQLPDFAGWVRQQEPGLIGRLLR
jgi:hypothetical protein